MQVAHFHTVVGEVVGQLFGHAFGEGGDQHALVFVHPYANFLQHIVHLVRGGSHFHLGVDQASGAHQLLDHTACMRLFVISRCGRHKHHLAHAFFKLFELQGAVV